MASMKYQFLKQPASHVSMRHGFSTSIIRESRMAEQRKCPVSSASESRIIGKYVSMPGSHTGSSLRPFDTLPGPKGLPIIGTLWDYLKKDSIGFNKMFQVMQKRSQEYGSVYREKIGPTISMVVVSDPEEYAKVIRVDGKYPHRTELEPMVVYRKMKGIGLGTVNSQGEEWHRHRVVLSKKTLRPKEVLEFCEAMNKVANDFIARLNKVREANGIIPEMEHEIFKWAMESICTVLFEERIGCFAEPPSQNAQEFIDNLMGFFKLMQPLMYNVPLYKIYPTKTWKKYEKFADRVLQLGQEFVNKKVEALQRQERNGVSSGEKEEKSAFLTYLLSQTTLTPEEANSHAVDLLMGAVETTSNASIWTMYCLAKFPHAQRALYEEVISVLGTDGQIIPEKLSQLPYVKACLKEMFRLYPITFATSRIIAESIELKGYHIPAGTHVQANLYGMGHDPALFSDPETFKPERWLRGDQDEDKSIMSMASLPWGHGARMCLGRRLAEQEIYIILVKIIQRFKLEYHEEEIQPVLNTVMTPDRPVKLNFIPRQH